MLTCLVPVLLTFYIQNVLKLKINNSGAKRLTTGTLSNTRRPTSRLTGWTVHTGYWFAGYWRGIGRSCARSPLHTYRQCGAATSPATDGMYIFRIGTNRRYLQQRKQDCWTVNRKDVHASGCGLTGSTANPRITRLIRSDKSSRNTKTRKVNNW